MLYVECYPDELLARLFHVPHRHIRHAHGKGNILNRLRRSKAGIGLVDEDPLAAQPADLQFYGEIKR